MSPTFTVCNRHKSLIPVGGMCEVCAEDRHRRGPADNRRLAAKHRVQGVNTAYWRKFRVWRIALADGMCEMRRPGCTLIATTVHLDPALGGDHRLARRENTLAACRRCHGAEDGARSRRAA